MLQRKLKSRRGKLGLRGMCTIYLGYCQLGSLLVYVFVDRFGSVRFGLSQSDSTDEDAKKKARLARFAPPAKADPVEEDKRKARALRLQ